MSTEQQLKEVETLQSHEARSLLRSISLSLLKWGLPVSGWGATAYFILENKWTTAVISILFTILLSFFNLAFNFSKKVSKKVLKRIEDKLDEQVDDISDRLFSKIEYYVLIIWWFLTSNFQRKYYQYLVYNYRTYRIEGLKTKGPFTPDLEKVFVSLKVAPESIDKISAAMIQQIRNLKEDKISLQIWDFLANLSQPVYQRIAIIAPPGAGKSTLLEHIALVYANNSQRFFHRYAPKLIPIVLKLREIRNYISCDHPLSLAETIIQQESISKLKPPPYWFERVLHSKRRRCLVMLDGLDEVADEDQRNKVSQWVDKQMVDYPESYFILTSRPFGYRSSPPGQIRTVLEVQPFSSEQVGQFIQSWYLQNEIMRQMRREDEGVRKNAKSQADDLIRRIENSSPLSSMATNPLLLTMIATVHDNRGALPGRRFELYAEICDVLLSRRLEAKHINDSLNSGQKRSVLQYLAFGLMNDKTRSFTLNNGKNYIREILLDTYGEEVTSEEFLKNIIQISGLIVERERESFEFAHMSFQEFLAACHIKDQVSENFLIGKIADPWWSETIRLYGAQNDITKFMQAILRKPTFISLSLGYECLEECLSINYKVREEFHTILEMELESDDLEIARLAAEVKLSRRLTKLQKVNERTEIDMEYISNAEYQNFINEMQREGKYYKPDHWTNNRFKPGKANEPVIGIRALDAESFCSWLTSKRIREDIFINTNYSYKDYTYRLPKLAEVNNYPASESRAGCWSYHGEKKIIADITQDIFHLCESVLISRFRFTYIFSKIHAVDIFSNNIHTLMWADDIVRTGQVSVSSDSDDQALELAYALELACDLYMNSSDTTPLVSMTDFAVAHTIVRNIVGTYKDFLGSSYNLSSLLLRNSLNHLLLSMSILQRDRYLFEDSNIILRFKSNKKRRKYISSLNRSIRYNINRRIRYIQTLEKARDSIDIRAKALVNFLARDLTGQIDIGSILDIGSVSNTSIPFNQQHCQLVTAYFLWCLLANIFEIASAKQDLQKTLRVNWKKCEELKQEYKQKSFCALQLYALYILLDLRKTGEMPCWEGIRIVRERTEK